MRTKRDKPLVLILCGGRSQRLWPLSENKSKNFLDFFGISPLELTLKRFLEITTEENIFLVANRKERPLLRGIKLIKKENIFFEPESKNTAAAVLFALQHLKGYPDKVLIISPVDNLIKGRPQFYSALRRAITSAEKGWIATVGMKPKEPTPRFGYIQADKKIDEKTYSVKSFVEKPSISKAKKLIKAGKSFYNSGMFVSSLKTFLEEYEKYYPAYHDFTVGCKRGRAPALYRKVKDLPFDKAIIEKSKRLSVVEGNFFWRDFGSWQAVYELLPKDRKGNVRKGKVFIHGGKKNFIHLENPKKKVLAIGINGIFFIDTPGYALLCPGNFINKLKPALKNYKKR